MADRRVARHCRVRLGKGFLEQDWDEICNVIGTDRGADRDKALAAAKGHVLAKGEIVGTYQQAQAPLK